MPPHLLIAEDDQVLRDALEEQLKQAGYTVSCAEDGATARQMLEQNAYDAILLDVGLPVLDGISLLTWARQRLGAVPVMMITARDDVSDRVKGLTAGADDYLTKPFDMQELLARVEALLRRARMPAFGGRLQITGDGGALLRLDGQLPLAWLDNRPLDVTQREWALLRLLISRKGEVVTREDVMQAWQGAPTENTAGSSSNALEVYVHRLRRKLTSAGIQIRNVRGLGYTLQTTG